MDISSHCFDILAGATFLFIFDFTAVTKFQREPPQGGVKYKG